MKTDCSPDDVYNGICGSDFVKMDFLDGRKTYKASIYKDGPTSSVDREDVAVEHKTLTAKDSLKIKLAPGGGLAVSFVPID